jgi:NAD+ synthase (glutamine-hydrolysing)
MTELDDTGKEYQHLKDELQDFLKSANMTKVIVGVSGGLDSAVVATLAADVLGGHNVLGVAMPSVYSSDHSLTDAEELMINLGGNYRVIPINPMFEAFQEALALTGIAEENIQARIRGMILMSISNMEGGVVLATGNKSEAMVGYCTMYGDTVGGFAPLVTTYKTDLYRIARWRNEQGLAIPVNTLTKPPSAELAEGQLDQDVLPDYDVLDPLLRHLLGEEEMEGFDLLPGTVVQNITGRMKASQWKREQYPPGPNG